MTRTLRVLAALAALMLPLPLAAQDIPAAGRSIIVLDASGSMWGQIGGRTKLDMAREALGEVLAGVDPEAEIGLMAYGHRQKGSCDDIELVVPPGKGTGPAIVSAADAMQFLGKTPLTDAVRKAAEDLRSTEEKATVILITDGVETCEADPCALGAELERSGVDFTAHVVGFGLSADEGAQVACLAEETGGQYLDAGDLASLTFALQTTVVSAPPAPEPEPEPEPAPPAALAVNFAPVALLAAGIPAPEDAGVVWALHARNADGSTGDWQRTEYGTYKGFVEPGTYRLVTTLGYAKVEQDLTVTAEDLTAPEVVLEAARVVLTPRATEGGPVADNAALEYRKGPDYLTTEYGARGVWLPAGQVTVKATLGQASVTEDLALTGGQLLERDILIASGRAVVDVVYAPGVKVEGGGPYVRIIAANAPATNDTPSLAFDYGVGKGFDLAPGEYQVVVRLDAAEGIAPLTVTGGQAVTVEVNLNAGVLAVNAPGATEIRATGKPDIAGNARQLAFDYKPAVQWVLPAGPVEVVITRDGETIRQQHEVKAGERVEANLP